MKKRQPKLKIQALHLFVKFVKRIIMEMEVVILK